MTASRASAAEDAPFSISYRAPRVCSEQGAFEARLAEHLGPLSARLAELVSSLTIVIDATDTGFQARLRLVDRAGHASARDVASPTCDEAMAAIALVTALAVRSQLERESPSPASEAAGAPADSSGASSEATASPDASQASLPETPGVAGAASGTANPTASGTASAASPVVAAPVPPAPPPSAPPELATPPAPRAASQPAKELALGVEFATGVGPGVAPGLRLAARLTWLGEFEQSLGVMAIASDTFRKSLDAADVRFSVLKGRLELCPLEPRLSPNFTLRPCAGFELGTQSGRSYQGEGVATAGSESRLWAAAVLGLGLGYRKGSFAAGLGVAAQLPLTENRFALSNPERLVYEVPPLAVAFHGQVGLVF